MSLSFPADNPDVIDSRSLLALLNVRLGRSEQARAWLQKIDHLKAQLQPLKRADRDFASALVEMNEGDLDTALASLERAEALREEALGSDDPRVWMAKIERAELLARRGSAADRTGNAALAKDILAHLDSTLAPDSPVRARIAKLL